MIDPRLEQFDQRFWGNVVFEKGIGPPPVHIDLFADQCVPFVNKALDPASEWCVNAKALDMGQEKDDGVHANVIHFAALVEAGRTGQLKPAAAAKGKPFKEAAESTERA